MKPSTLRELLRLLLSTHFSNRHIAQLTQLSKTTVRRYRSRINKSECCWEEVKQLDDPALFRLASSSSGLKPEKRAPDWSQIHKLLQDKHQCRLQIWEEYRRINPDDAYCYSQFNKYYRDYRKTIDLCMRQHYEPGDVCFVDYAGKRLSFVDSATGQTQKVELFVGVLGYSQLIFCMATVSQKQEDWIYAHEQMLKFYRGTPRLIIPDNLKSAVTKTGRFITINRAYQELADHYGFVVEPARVRRPQDKSLGEIGVLLVTRWITTVLKRRQFFALDEINQAIKVLLPALNKRNFKRYEGCRQSRFDETEGSALQPLPAQPFEYGVWLPAQTVPGDYHIYVYNHAYSVPYTLAGAKVEVKVSHQKVEIFHQHHRVAIHPRSNRKEGATTYPEHRPTQHQAYANQTRDYFINWAKEQSADVLAVVTAQFENLPEHSLKGIRACSKLQKLCRHYGVQRFMNACTCVTEIHSLTVSSVHSILQCHLDGQQITETTTQHKLPAHSNVRGASYYADYEGHLK
ncbi:IS21 family transposase [Thalassotalea sp. G20_0]|uniref:IS21 family transposase n=1 Tax=Thalassotalea sp. G20_0 TaxID=2821093 RepID=UPI001ADBBDD4|nr:IS21 family transposase [Thalassotalea sp. G20_0]MBO9493046.1 IS21 family transposase [Thalassotalea sp. G20_0]